MAIEAEFEPVSALYRNRKGLECLHAGDVNHRDRAILGVRRPDLSTIRGDIKAFRASAGRNVRDFPYLAGPHLRMRDADRARRDIGRVDMLQIPGDEHHVGPVLAGTQDPVDSLRNRIVATYGLVCFSGEIQLTAL